MPGIPDKLPRPLRSKPLPSPSALSGSIAVSNELNVTLPTAPDLAPPEVVVTVVVPAAASCKAFNKADIGLLNPVMPNCARMRVHASPYRLGAMLNPDRMEVRYSIVASARGAKPNADNRP